MIYLFKALVSLLFYCLLYFSIDKKINIRILKAILLMIITPFFFYYFAVNFVHPLSYISYITGVFKDFHGILILVVDLMAKKTFFLVAIIVAAIPFLNKR